MSHKSLRILLVQDPAGDRPDIHEILLKSDIVQFELEYVPANLAWRCFSNHYYDVCIIDSAGRGINLLQESRKVSFASPIIMLTSDSAREILNAMRQGAADCLIRENLTAAALEESIYTVIDSAHYRECQSAYARDYLALVENSREIIYTHNLRGNPTFINRAGEQLMGFTHDEILDKNLCQIFAPECLESVWRIIDRMLADRKQSSFETVMLTKEGRRIPVSVTMHLIYQDGNPIGVQGIARELRWRIPTASTLPEGEQRYQKTV